MAGDSGAAGDGASDARASGTDAGALAPVISLGPLKGDSSGGGDGGRDAEGSGTGARASSLLLLFFLPFALALVLGFAAMSASPFSGSGYVIDFS